MSRATVIMISSRLRDSSDGFDAILIPNDLSDQKQEVRLFSGRNKMKIDLLFIWKLFTIFIIA